MWTYSKSRCAFVHTHSNTIGIIQDAICLEESDTGHAVWHLYAAQRHRTLKVKQTTISDAYNVVLQYEFLSDAKIRVAERLHGKPAIVNMGPVFGFEQRNTKYERSSFPFQKKSQMCNANIC